MKIPFNVPPLCGAEMKYVAEAIQSHQICGDGMFTKRCSQWFQRKTGAAAVLLTTSGTSALELAALLAETEPGDEVIMSSYTFSSTANAFVLRGAKIVFVDIRPDTMNLDERLIEAAITPRTRAIVPMHYAGVACEMDAIMDLAARYGLAVIEDAAQGVMSTYKGKPLGTIGDMGCYSFHETKNYSMGEGGALLLRDRGHMERAEILREKGTDRSKFWRGQVDKYTWVDMGSSFLPSELNSAYLFGQLEMAQVIFDDRMNSWQHYYDALTPLARQGLLELPVIPAGCGHNAHMFYIKLKDKDQRQSMIAHLKKLDIAAVFHYIPLHTAPAGKQFGRFCGEDIYTTRESERLLRLPMYYGLKAEDIERVTAGIKSGLGV